VIWRVVMTVSEQRHQSVQRKPINNRAREPRVHFRYQNFEVIDEIELEARKLGLKKNDWVKLAIQEKLDRDTFKHIFEQERIKGDFETWYLVRNLAGPELTSKAKAEVSGYLEESIRHDD